MASSLTTAGLTIDDINTLIANLTATLQAIYGSDINVNSNSPDGQLINAFCQVAEDTLELLQSIYNSFGYQTAYGTQLDQRVALMGIERNEGTYTQTPVLITVNQAVTLYGIDQTAQPAYTIADTAGNQYELLVTKAFGAAGSASLLFQAVAIGQIEVTPNTITVPVTSVQGVAAINNPATTLSVAGNISSGSPTVSSIVSTTGIYPGMTVTGTGIPQGTKVLSVGSSTQITLSANATATTTGVSLTIAVAATTTGVNEENDTQLKIRAAQSFALASTGPADAVSAALLSVTDVTDAYVVENFTDATVNGTEPHTIWCIVTGGADADIAQAIYAKKGIGCGMRGATTYVIARPNGTSFTAHWDASIAQALTIRFTINPITAGQAFDTAGIATQLAAALTYKLGDAPNIGDVVRAMQTIAPTSYQTNLGVSRDGGANYFDVVQPTDSEYYFTVSSINIHITT